MDTHKKTGSKMIYIFITLLLLPFSAFSSSFPSPATAISTEVDQMYLFIHALSLGCGLLIIGVFIVFAVLYRRKNNSQATATVHHNTWLEWTWSIIPFLIFMFMFTWGWWVYDKMRTPYKNALEIHVYGQMWNWDYAYKNGRKTAETLYVPVNTPVKLIMTSRDVIHSFYVPAFRIKQDVLPNRYTALWFKATKKGLFNVFCTEYCGTGHYSMLSKIRVVSLEDWEKWISTDPYEGLGMVEIGQKVFRGRCTACHQTTVQKMIGPGLAGVFGSVRNFEENESIKADENYIRESILNPSARIVKDFPDQMTPFAGLLQEEEMTGLVEYIKSLKPEK